MLGLAAVMGGLFSARFGLISVALVTGLVVHGRQAVGYSIPLVTVPTVLLVAVLGVAISGSYARGPRSCESSTQEFSFRRS